MQHLQHLSVDQIFQSLWFLSKGFLVAKISHHCEQIYGCQHDIINCNGISVSQITMDMFHLSKSLVLFSFMIYHQVCNKNNMTGVYPSGGPEFTPSFQWGLCCLVFSFLCSALQIVVCLFVLFLLAIVLSVLLRFPLWHLQTFLIIEQFLLNSK